MIFFKKIDHIQICIPKGEIQKAQKFYCNILGFTLLDIPKAFEGRELLWVGSGGIEIHIGTEPISPLSSRHIAFEIENIKETRTYLESKEVQIKESTPLSGRERFVLLDPWGNKIELLEYL